jgi:hypothetical protein
MEGVETKNNGPWMLGPPLIFQAEVKLCLERILLAGKPASPLYTQRPLSSISRTLPFQRLGEWKIHSQVQNQRQSQHGGKQSGSDQEIAERNANQEGETDLPAIIQNRRRIVDGHRI